MTGGTLDYGDYDGVYEMCTCGALVVEPGARQCKSCARRAEGQRREAADLEKKLANHRQFKRQWYGRIISDYARSLRGEVDRALEEIRAA